MRWPYAIILGAVIVAAALLYTQRYQTVTGGGRVPVMWRIDVLTGQTHACVAGQPCKDVSEVGER